MISLVPGFAEVIIREEREQFSVPRMKPNHSLNYRLFTMTLIPSLGRNDIAGSKLTGCSGKSENLNRWPMVASNSTTSIIAK